MARGIRSGDVQRRKGIPGVVGSVVDVTLSVIGCPVDTPANLCGERNTEQYMGICALSKALMNMVNKRRISLPPASVLKMRPPRRRLGVASRRSPRRSARSRTCPRPRCWHARGRGRRLHPWRTASLLVKRKGKNC